MKELVARFAEVMRETYAVHGELLGLSEGKKSAILDKNIASLDGIVRKEQLLIARQKDLERRRLACVEEFSQRTGERPENITMLVFAEHAEPEQAQDLRALAEKLMETLNKLRKSNDINNKMIQGRLEFINCMIDSISSLQETSVYSAKGLEAGRGGKAAKLYDKKV
ncbi:MAG: flagellar protein FlgN [Oscillospiraceae bacterium]|nr:flagellar protein FlgN [Oscillospiraceae bacterium]